MADEAESLLVQETKSEVTTALVNVATFAHRHRELIPMAKMEDTAKGLLATVLQKESLTAAASKQDLALGEKQHPFDFTTVKSFELTNVFHARSLKTKTNATVGLGFIDDKINETLDPLCSVSWQDVFMDGGGEFWNVGTGYIEVVREDPTKENSPILGLHHMPATDPIVFLEDRHDYHYLIRNTSDAAGTKGDIRFARFGDSANFIKRAKGGSTIDFNQGSPETTSELIVLRQPSAFSRWYGFPDWLAGTAVIEVASMFLQYVFDFFLNRGVPEFMLFVTGAKLAPDDWTKIEKSIQDNIGQGQSHKSVAVNIANADVEVELIKLGVDSGLDKEWTKFSDSLDLKMVTAHGVPPLLAGIQTPGKLGANNEMANAMAAFQTLIIGPAQQLIASALATSLGDPKKNGGLGLTRKDFFTTEDVDDGNLDPTKRKTRKKTRTTLVRITDEINVGDMDTLGRMKDEAASPEGRARDLSEGTQD